MPPAERRELLAEATDTELAELEQLLEAEDRAAEYPTPGALAVRLDPQTRNPPHLELLDAHLVAVAERRIRRLMVVFAPQEGKSERTARRFPLWLLQRNRNLRIAIVSFEDESARRWGRTIRDDLTVAASDPNLPDLGLALREDSRAAGRWNLAGSIGSVYCTGWQGPLTGRPVDVLIIDDPVKDREAADSAAYREALWNWYTDVARTRLSPDGVIVLIMTRWHEDDLAGRLQDKEADLWTVLRVPAEADHDPERGETDPVGRQPGEFLESARGPERVQDWLETKARRPRTWQALYQGKPSPPAGTILQRDWWRRYPVARVWELLPDGRHLVNGSSRVVQSWDMAFKATAQTDYVVGQVWEIAGAEMFLLDQVRARMDFVATLEAVKGMRAKWPQTGAVLVEDKANGPAVISSLRTQVPGLIAVEPRGSKEARASAVAPFVQAGNVHVPDGSVAPWVEDFVEEAAGFPNAAHDDQVDAMSQALSWVYLPEPAQQKAGRVVTSARWGAARR